MTWRTHLPFTGLDHVVAVGFRLESLVCYVGRFGQEIRLIVCPLEGIQSVLRETLSGCKSHLGWSFFCLRRVGIPRPYSDPVGRPVSDET